MPKTPSFPDRQALRRIPLPEWIDPAAAFDELYAGSPYAVWLDAGAGATTGTSYLAGGHERSLVVTASAPAGTTTRSRPLAATDAPVTTRDSVFDVLRRDLARSTSTPNGNAPVAADDVGFRLGWVGWLGYGLAQPTAAAGTGLVGAPDAALLRVDRAVAFDHAARTVTLLVRPEVGEPEGELDAWVAETSRRLAQAGRGARPPAQSPGNLEVRWRHDPEQYARLIGQCQARIRAGDAYQLCLTNEITVAGAFDPGELYRRLRDSSPSHHGGLLRFGEHALLSASPEQFLSVSPGGRICTRPIKGTRPRATDPAHDRILEAELLASDKERAENLMIVDLMRNDLGRVAELGTVAVTALLQVESYPHVHQLVSTIEAQLAPGLTAVDAVQAAFPAGSMTGAPKASAMAILHELEGGERGVYAGAFGYLGQDGALDLAMVIRSIVLGPAGASIGTGGGITALSVAAEEIEETRVKAAALIRALLGTEPGPDPAEGQGLVT
ncbi:anthranilate synthase component I family protein [Cryobacterium sp.]|uniref:anthranilate synthase component I family protein n=1 Tax=Cryobacterium sp. TaxID=1926290 RepID=UPI002638762D|nr:anthranilate synthase component I family protein [Cryobacterium sp.]MCU1446241.1 anthranilate synthase [Cryobacterium sp.]